MTRTRRWSFTAVAVLQAIASGYRYGFDIMDITELPSGTVYPVLSRLQDSGLVDSRWEDHAKAHDAKRPPRKYYDLTGIGAEVLREEANRYRMLDRLQADPSPRPRTADA